MLLIFQKVFSLDYKSVLNAKNTYTIESITVIIVML